MDGEHIVGTGFAGFRDGMKLPLLLLFNYVCLSSMFVTLGSKV